MKKINKILIPLYVLFFSLTISNAQGINVSGNTKVNVTSQIPVVSTSLDNETSVNSNTKVSDNAKQNNKTDSDTNHPNPNNISSDTESVTNIWGKINRSDLKLYVGFTNNAELNTKIKSLREEYKEKLEDIKNDYLNDLKDLVNSNELSINNNVSASNTTQLNKGNSEENIATHLGFWAKIKSWLGFNK